MSAETCFKGICFFALDPNTPKIFSFAELLSGMAIMILAWTIADVRYRFRINCAPFPIHTVSFYVVSFVGLATLLTDLWIGAGWYVPKGNLINTVEWQAMLAGLILVTFFIWSWFAFIKPPKFGRFNAAKYAHNLHDFIQRSKSEELSVIADEIQGSIDNILLYASGDNVNPKNNKQYQAAMGILLLIADQRFCSAIISSSPSTILRFFNKAREAGHGGWMEQIGPFAKNILTKALENRDSFIYRETSAYESGVIGHQKLITNAMFSDHYFLESIRIGLDVHLKDHNWSPDQFEAYARCIEIAFDDYCERSYPAHTYVMHRALYEIVQQSSSLYGINGNSNNWALAPEVRKTRIGINLIMKMLTMLDKHDCQPPPKRLVDGFGDIYISLSRYLLDIIHDSATMTLPYEKAVILQRNDVWMEIFRSPLDNGSRATKEITFKLRRMIYDEIKKMEKFPNFKGANLMRLCLSMMGFNPSKEFGKDTYALNVAILAWLKKNYVSLHKKHYLVADACLPENISFDQGKMKLTKVSPPVGLRIVERYSDLELEKRDSPSES